MPYYDEQGRQGYHRSPSRYSQSPTYVAPEDTRYKDPSYNIDRASDYSRHPRRPSRSEYSSSTSSRSPSSSRSNRKVSYQHVERRDKLAKVGIIIGAVAVVAGVTHLLKKHNAEQQLAMQRERRAEMARRRERRRKEDEEDRRMEQEEQRREEYDDWRRRGKSGMYIEAPPPGYKASKEESAPSRTSRNSRQ